MRAVAIFALLLLAGCNQQSRDDRIADEAADAAADVVAESPKLRDLESRIDELEARLDRESRFLSAVDNSLTESRENHTALLKTFNSNADKANRRDQSQERDIDWLMQRQGVYRNQ